MITPLGTGREFDAVRELVARWGPLARGIGDDCAFLSVPAGETLCVSTDTSVEGTHFRRDWLSDEEIGYRATTAALSDLAAVAARPLALLWAVTLSDGDRASLGALADGVADAARRVGATIAGGDLTSGAAISLTLTVLGSTRRPLRRGGAAPGQTLYVTGRLGGPQLALRAWLAGEIPPDAARRRFARPDARVREALWLAEHGATAAVDLSDGLAGDAGHLAAASGVSLDVDLARLPLAPGATPRDAATSGEEYELVVAAPPDLPVTDFEAAFDVALTAIGSVAAGPGVARFHDGGARVDLGAGYDHFSR